MADEEHKYTIYIRFLNTGIDSVYLEHVEYYALLNFGTGLLRIRKGKVEYSYPLPAIAYFFVKEEEER